MLRLIGPNGEVRIPTTIKGAMTILAWSGDGQRVLVQGAVTQGGPVVVELVTLPSGAVSPVSIPSDVESQLIGFTRPRGLAILDLTTPGLHGWTLERRSLSGAHPVTLATGVGAAGAVVPTADGEAYLVGLDKDTELVSNRAGVAPIVVPHSAGCIPVRLWSSTTFLAHCGQYLGYGRLMVLGLHGGRPQLIARDTAKPLAINDEAYPGRGGIYTRTEGPCGSDWISGVGANGVTRPIVNPGGAIEYSLLTSDQSDLAVVVTDAPCGSLSRTSLAWMNPQTRTVHTIYRFAAGSLAMFVPFSTYNGVE